MRGGRCRRRPIRGLSHHYILLSRRSRLQAPGHLMRAHHLRLQVGERGRGGLGPARHRRRRVHALRLHWPSVSRLPVPQRLHALCDRLLVLLLVLLLLLLLLLVVLVLLVLVLVLLVLVLVLVVLVLLLNKHLHLCGMEGRGHGCR